MKLERSRFGNLPDGRQVNLYTLTNDNGIEVAITNYGGILTSIMAPDRYGELADVVLGFDDLDGYLADHPYFGAIVGRYANRIARGVFELDSKTHRLTRNNGRNHLHGGVMGFDRSLWSAKIRDPGVPRLDLFHFSPDGDEGYPGSLDIRASYTLNDDNELRLDFRAVTDRPTHVNLTNHSYFNLGGPATGNVLDHELSLGAHRVTPVDADLIPTGELREVEGSPMDFRKPTAVGAMIDADDDQIRLGVGYDHNFVLDTGGDLNRIAARLVEPGSGRVLEVRTTEPGIQLYTGNFLDGSISGKGGKVHNRRCALCLETQHFPNSPNIPGFPSTVLRPGETYRSTTIYRFGVDS